MKYDKLLYVQHSLLHSLLHSFTHSPKHLALKYEIVRHLPVHDAVRTEQPLLVVTGQPEVTVTY